MTVEPPYYDDLEPIFSVLVPTMYRRRTILESLQSVFAQTFKPIEIVVLDIGDNLETRQEICDFAGSNTQIDIRYLPFPGPLAPTCISRNFAIAEAQGTFIAYLDDDDIWEPNYLARAAEEIEKNKSHFVITGFQNFNNEGNIGEPEFPPEDFEFECIALSNPGFVMSNMIFHRRLMLASGGLDPYVLSSSDKAMVATMVEAGARYQLIAEVLVRKRVGQSMQFSVGRSGNSKRILPGAWRFFRKYASRMSFPTKLRYGKKLGKMCLGVLLGK